MMSHFKTENSKGDIIFMTDFECTTLGVYIQSCRLMRDHRSDRRKVYSLELLLFALLVTEFAAIPHQRGRQRYLKGMWSWILLKWHSLSGEVGPNSSPSQSTLCRLMANVDSFALKNIFLKRVNLLKINQRKPLPGLSFPQYAVDGKSRKGIQSPETGRTEMDVSIIDVESRTVVAKMALSDKKGESRIASFLVSDTAKNLDSGIITSDAGITCPKFLKRVINGNLEYIAAIKANAGLCYEDVKNFDWDKIQDFYVSENQKQKHGRIEFREIKKVPVKVFGDKFSKYPEIGAILAVKSRRTIKGKTSSENRFFVSSKALCELPLKELLGYIRGHWLIENGLHWVKDAILKEDNAREKSKKSSRLLGMLKDLVVSIGYKIFKSVREFIDVFKGNPRDTFELLLN